MADEERQRHGADNERVRFLCSLGEQLGLDDEAEAAPPKSLQEALARVTVWRKTSDVDQPWETTVDGRVWRIRLGDFPAESSYTLSIDGEDIGSFDDWPKAWTR